MSVSSRHTNNYLHCTQSEFDERKAAKTYSSYFALYKDTSEILIFTTHPGTAMYSCGGCAQDKDAQLKGQKNAKI